MNLWKLHLHVGQRPSYRYISLSIFFRFTFRLEGWLNDSFHHISSKISKRNGLSKHWKDIGRNFACSMMMSRYAHIVAIQLLYAIATPYVFHFLIVRFVYDFLGNCWCCTGWTIGNCKSPRSAFIRLCEPKDCCGGSWKVLRYSLEIFY